MAKENAPPWWSKVDWSLNNARIARQLGRSYKSVRTARQAAGAPGHARGQPKGSYHKDLSAVDWTRPDAEIARQLGTTRQNVAQHRRKLGEPAPSPSHPRQLKIDWPSLDWSKGSAATVPAGAKLLKAREDGTELDLDLADGSTVKLTLADPGNSLAMRDRDDKVEYMG